MVHIEYIHEVVHHDKEYICGWSYREIKKRIDYKTRETIFVKYKGYCQKEREDYDDEDFTEEIYITCQVKPFPNDKDSARYSKKIKGKNIYKNGKWTIEYNKGEGDKERAT